MRQGGGGVDELHQGHVARWVKKVNAAKTRFNRLGQSLAELGNRQARGIGRHDGTGRHKRGNLLVQIELPVHALGNGFDHQIAAFKQFEVFFVIGGLNQGCIFGQTQRGGLEFFKPFHGTRHDAVLGAFFGRQIKQEYGHPDIDQMGRNLRPHHTGTENGYFFNLKAGHGSS